jgi:hypothetical protein
MEGKRFSLLCAFVWLLALSGGRRGTGCNET